MRRLLAVVVLCLCITSLALAKPQGELCGSLPCVPGLDSIGIGFDVVKGQNRQQPIINFSYASNFTYEDPFSGQVYAFPDQANVVQMPTFGIQSFVFRSGYELSAQFSKDSGISAGVQYEKAFFSGSYLVQKANSVLNGGDALFAMIREFSTIYEITLDPAVFLQTTSVFQQLVNNLPTTYNRVSYAQFVSTMGTHVIQSARFGGLATVTTSVASSYNEQYSDEIIEANAKLQYSLLKRGVGPSYNREGSTSSFQNACGNSWSVQLQGGQSTLPLSEWSQWIDSIRQLPVQVTFQLVNITDLIQDPKKRQNLETYLVDYYNSSITSNNTRVPEYPIELASCDCQYVDGRCPTGFFVQSTNTHDPDNLAGRPYLCCRPCLSWTQSSAFVPSSSIGISDAQPLNLKDKSKPKTSSSECSIEPTPNGKCGNSYPCLPGIDALGVGFDAIKGQRKGLQVIDFTFDQEQLWQNPFVPQLIYVIPDQSRVTDVPQSNVEVFSILSRDQYSQFLSQQTGIDINLGFFALSDQVESLDSTFYGQQSAVVLVQQLVSLFEATLEPPEILNTTASFQQMVNALPHTLNQTLYENFFEAYGTHVIVQATYGGKAQLKISVDQNYYSQNSISNIESNAQLMFEAFKAQVYQNSTQTLSFAQFNNASFAEFTLEGGSYEDLSASQWSQWVNSTQCLPAQVDYQLVPITRFVQDPVIRKNLLLTLALRLNRTLSLLPHIPPVGTNSIIAVNCNYLSDGDSSCSTIPNTIYFGSQNEHSGFPSGFHYDIQPNGCCGLQWNSTSTQPPGTPTLCNCQTGNGSVCPTGSFVQGFHATYHKDTIGNYNQPPVTCCSVCYSPSKQSKSF